MNAQLGTNEYPIETGALIQCSQMDIEKGM